MDPRSIQPNPMTTFESSKPALRALLTYCLLMSFAVFGIWWDTHRDRAAPDSGTAKDPMVQEPAPRSPERVREDAPWTPHKLNWVPKKGRRRKFNRTRWG